MRLLGAPIKKYLYSIFVRGFISFSGFLVFLVSAKLFGAEGRGIISYGTSVFASIGIILSFNLGRAYLSMTHKNEKLKNELLPVFVLLNLLAVGLTATLALIFWSISASAQDILHFDIMLALIASSSYFVWSINGNAFFASFQITHRQETVILLTRGLMLLFLGSFYFADVHSIKLFLTMYSFILCAGVIFEIFTLIQNVRPTFVIPSIKNLRMVLAEAVWPHIDFLAFNLFPLFLILIAGQSLEKAEIGRINFTIQMINFIYLLSTTANIRVSSYVSTVGFQSRIPQLKKLLWVTLVVSLSLSTVTIFIIDFLTQTSYFKSFQDTSSLFIIAILSIPGYLAYQILNPILLEMKIIKRSAVFGVINALVFLFLAIKLVPIYREVGAMYLFSLFHCGLLLVQITFFVKLWKQSKSY